MRKLLLTFVFLLQSSVFAHGENKLGPNGGFIRMPGFFHTELVQLNDRDFVVYLMNVNNENPTINNSKVELQYLSTHNLKTSFTCKPTKNHFVCKLGNKKINFKAGKILLTAEREGEKGKVAEYQLPLSLSK